MSQTLETDRLILRPYTINDAKAVFEFGSNKEVQRYTGDPLLKSEDEAKNIIQNVNLTDYKKYGYGRLAVVLKSENQVIGFAGLKFLEELHQTDIGYRFLPQYWGKGIATEAGHALIKYGFEVLNLKEIIGISMQQNIGSIKVLEKIGLTYYKTDQYDGDGEQHYWYKIERNSYLNQNKKE